MSTRPFFVATLVFATCAALFSAARAAPDEPRRVSVHRTVSRVLGEERVYRVVVPPRYETGQTRFPVLYVLDGEGQLEHTVATADFLARTGRAPAMIVVGVHNTDRTRDFTPTRASFQTGVGRRDFPTSGGADHFLKFLRTELIPEVERKHRTQPYRVLAGHSFGGLFALHVFTTAPDAFDAYLAVSPTFSWDDSYLVRKVRAVAESGRPLKKSLYFTVGEEPDLKPGFDEWERLLGEAKLGGLEWASREFADEDHGSVVLPSHYYGLRSIFSAWLLPVDPKTGRFVGGVPELKAHFEKLSLRFGYTVMPSEQATNLLGYNLVAEKRHGEAIEVFEMNARNYPESANVYDSLGEGLETVGRLEEARDNYRKAVEFGRKNNDQYLAAYRDHLAAVEKKLKNGGGTR